MAQKPHLAAATQVSLVVSTLGRTHELEKLFDSLAAQHFKSFEVIIVDQNGDGRLAPLCVRQWPFAVRRISVPDVRGLSRGRNIGWRVAEGELVLFPDDDCWYPPDFLARAVGLLRSCRADVLTGRAADEAGRDINGRYAQQAHVIDRSNVWISGIEWVMMFRKTALEAIGGFNEDVGVGAATPWQACEGQEVLLRAISAGLACRYDPGLFGHHLEFDVLPPVPRRRKARAYGRGLGYVLRIHDYNVLSASWWLARPFAAMGLAMLRADTQQGRYYFNVALGRFEGLLGRTFGAQSR
jgi:glycosyltransferase involved in cell wall biosynthesis